MAIYDMATAIRQPDAANFSTGFKTGQEIAQSRRTNQARNALARLAQGDQTALPELMQADPEAGMKWQDMQKANEFNQGLQGFFKPATGATNVVGVNSLSALANPQPAQPAGYDFDGAMNYAASRGEIEKAGSLAALRDKMRPQSAKYYGGDGQEVLTPDGRRALIAMTEAGPVELPYQPVSKPKISGGWILGNDGLPAMPLPMTPKEAASDRRATEAAARADRQLEVSLAGLQQNQDKTRQEMQDKALKSQQERDGKYKAVNDLDSTLAAYRAALSGATRTDLANPVGDKSVELQNLATQLQMAYKNAADLGAITGPDWAIINRIVATPSGAKAALLGPEKLLKQLDQVDALSKRQRAELDRVYGGQNRRPNAGGNGAAYQEYLDAFNRAKTPEQKRAITERARQMGVVK